MDKIKFKNLDILTEKGKESKRDEDIVLNYIKKQWGLDVIETNKKTPSSLDGVLVKKNIIVACFEIKCRNLSIEEFEKLGSWIITKEKIDDGIKISGLLKIPFIGFLFLKKSNCCLYCKFTNDNGDLLIDLINSSTETQKTINGGRIMRINSYVDKKYLKYF